MTFDEYQNLILKTADYPKIGRNMVYTALGLAGEAGEVADKVKKYWRNNYAEMGDFAENGLSLSPEQYVSIVKEMGDALWYLAALATELGTSLGYIAEGNIEKTTGRKERGTVLGEGDNR